MHGLLMKNFGTELRRTITCFCKFHTSVLAFNSYVVLFLAIIKLKCKKNELGFRK